MWSGLCRRVVNSESGMKDVKLLVDQGGTKEGKVWIELPGALVRGSS